jgi:D-alanyl-lipoteichoic acid acyltransferase DltB (MBOAT superfamily)
MLLIALVVFNTAVLVWYKYANIVAATVSDLMQHYGAMPLAWQKVALPAGLSFIVLQAISYLVDASAHGGGGAQLHQLRHLHLDVRPLDCRPHHPV